MTELTVKDFSIYQIEQYLKVDPNQTKILQAALKPLPITALKGYSAYFQDFIANIESLKIKFNIDASKLFQDFQQKYTCYKNFDKQTKSEILAKIERFCALFDKDQPSLEDFNAIINDDLVWPKALDSSLLKKSAKIPSQIHYKDIDSEISRALSQIVTTSRDPAYIFATIARKFKHFLARYKKIEELFSPDDFLVKMNSSLENEEIRKEIQNEFQAVIIDEFQDTDPIQWQIFQKLFLPARNEWPGALYLVGDPKQSIYSFRQADIYTYLDAIEKVGENKKFSLNKNFRSHPHLIEALNALFSRTEKLFSLPQADSFLAYEIVSAQDIPQVLPEDGKEALHFIVHESELDKSEDITEIELQTIFPFMAAEMHKILDKDLKIAILVRDRHQATRAAAYLAKEKIECNLQKIGLITESRALADLILIIKAILKPSDQSLVKAALGSELIGFASDELKNFDHTHPVYQTIISLHHSLFESSFGSFIATFLQAKFHPRSSVQDNLLGQIGGKELLSDLLQLLDIILEHENIEWFKPPSILQFLSELTMWDAENPKLKKVVDQGQKGVNILTLHYSKGLEFDVVFAIGLIVRKSVKDLLITVEKNGEKQLTPISECSHQKLAFWQEIDAEKSRQLYVAMTRAKYRLYVPLIARSHQKKISYGEAAPLDIFLANFNQNSSSYEEMYAHLNGDCAKNLLQFIMQDGSKYHISASCLESYVSATPKQPADQIVNLIAPAPVTKKFPSCFINSFTALKIASNLSTTRANYAPNDFQAIDKNIHTLPSSAETGILLHQILQHIDMQAFSHINLQQADKLIEPYVRNSNYEEWLKPISELIYNLLTIKFEFKETNFSLSSLDSKKIFREISFLYPSADDGKSFLQGVIDLMFELEGKVYLIDWKSNWLGEDSSYYSQSQLQKAMKENNYFLQARIYENAVQKYLKIFNTANFGGISYVFMRGINNPTKGVYFMPLA